MKQLRILAVYGKYKSHKEVTFEVPEELRGDLPQTPRGRNRNTVEGNVNMKINLSILDADQKF